MTDQSTNVSDQLTKLPALHQIPLGPHRGPQPEARYPSGRGGRSSIKKALIGLSALIAVALPAVALTVPAATAQAAVRLVGTFPNQSDNSNGGYLLYSNGKVLPLGGAPYYGNGVGAKVDNFVALVSDSQNPGYWLVTSTGKIVSVGELCNADQETLQGHSVAGSIVGAVNASGSLTEGFDEVNAAGATSEYQCNFSM